MSQDSHDTNGNGVLPQVPETIPIDDVNQFAQHLIAWHKSKVAHCHHLLKVPEGAAFEIGEETLVLTADVLKGFKFGIEMALMQLGTLPIAVEFENDAPG